MADTRVDRESEEWREARKRVSDRRDFGSHLVTYVVVNSFFVFMWAFTGGGYFWPAWIIGGWGIGLVLHAWEVFFRRPITDDEIEAEIHHHV